MERWNWPPIWSHKTSKPNSKKSRLWIFCACRICQFQCREDLQNCKAYHLRDRNRERERESWFGAARDPGSVFRSEEVGWRKGHIWRSWVAQPDFRLSHFVLPRPAGKKIYHPFLDSPIWNTKICFVNPPWKNHDFTSSHNPWKNLLVNLVWTIMMAFLHFYAMLDMDSFPLPAIAHHLQPQGMKLNTVSFILTSRVVSGIPKWFLSKCQWHLGNFRFLDMWFKFLYWSPMVSCFCLHQIWSCCFAECVIGGCGTCRILSDGPPLRLFFV